MPPNHWTFLAKRCPVTTTSKLVMLVLLGILAIIYNTQILYSPLDMCFPKTNIAFLKTHKCAGSSIQNILMRFGDVHKLTFVFPESGNYLGHPAPFNRNMVDPPRLPSYNILAHHTRLDYGSIRRIMPANTVFVTILRDPVEVFESAYSYYTLGRVLGGSLHKFLAKVPSMDAESLNRRFKGGKLGRNQMMFDLGADPSIFDNETLVRRYIGQLDSWFDLVLLADRMEESLVFLRHLMCWDVDDVITFKLNARDPKYKSVLKDSEKDVLRQLNHADVLLYDHFLEKFDRAVEDFGRDRMVEETKQLRERTKKWYSYCIKGEEQHRKPSAKPKHYFNYKVLEFKMNAENNTSCKSMTMEELPYTDMLRKRQQTKVKRRAFFSLRSRYAKSTSSKKT